MPYRFDEQSQKVVSDSSTANTKTDLKAQKAPKSSQGNLAPAGVSQSKQGLASASMEKSRRRTLGQAMIQPDLRPILKKGLIIIGASIVALAGVIYVTSQQHKFGQIKSGGAAQESSQSVNFPAGKKITPLVMSQSIARLAAKARDDGDNEAAVALYARAAEEARLGGPALNKQYIDALSSQAEIYQFSLAQSDKAKPLFEKVLKAQTADSSTRPKKLASTYNNLADTLRTLDDPDKNRILIYFQKAIALAKVAGDHEGQALYDYNAGDYNFDLGQYDKALALGKDSLAQLAKVKEPNFADLADSHYLVARSHSRLPGPAHIEAAQGEFDKALKNFDKALADDEGAYDKDRHGNCLREAAWNKLKMGNRAEAKELFDRASSYRKSDEPGRTSDTYMSEALN